RDQHESSLVPYTALFRSGTMRPGEDERVTQEVLASHVRATLANRSYDVASSDQHTVKPWLSARLAFSPPVADLSASGFDLVGGRSEEHTSELQSRENLVC